jgi:uncharacterized protein (DUF1800 family)
VPVPVFTNPTAVRHMQRLLWRAGFGPAPGQAEQLASTDLRSTVYSLTRPAGAANLVGPTPRDDNGSPLAPADFWGHDHCFWLDRMIRSDQPLVERMALIWHDWFATSNGGVDSQQQMLDQCQMFRDRGLGSFLDLLKAVTQDPAMLTWLNGTSNTRWDPNENYAREVMELFTLGADRGAYTEQDIREAARALTGFRNDWSAELGNYNFRFDPTYHDDTPKTIFGQTGNYDWQALCQMLVAHPLHASFFVTKLWGYFIPTPPDNQTLAGLQNVYISSGYGIRPVVEAILQHPAFYDGPELVKEPVVYTAGLLRAVGRGIDTTAWAWLDASAGQQLYYPPNVSGWDYARWLDTCTLRGRWQIANYASQTSSIDPWASSGGYDPGEDAPTAVSRALGYWGNPTIGSDAQQTIAAFAQGCLPWPMQDWQNSPYRAMRQNALRMLIATSPDFQTS